MTGYWQVEGRQTTSYDDRVRMDVAYLTKWSILLDLKILLEDTLGGAASAGSVLKTKILVTGGAGYVGSVCAAQLIAEGHHVVVLDDLSAGHRRSVPTRRRLRIAVISPMSRCCARSSVSTRRKCAFHFAAKATIPESVVNPGLFFDVNVAASIRLLELLRAAGVAKFVFSSTAAVYGTPHSSPICEEDPMSPVNSYGATKLMLEQVLRWYASAYQWSVVAFRYFNASGSTPEHGELHDPETHILPLLLQVASGRRSHFEIYGIDYATPDGTCLRDYVHVSDIAGAHLLALQRMQNSGFVAYNIGTGTSYSVRQVCDMVEKVTGNKLRDSQRAAKAGRPPCPLCQPEEADGGPELEA